MTVRVTVRVSVGGLTLTLHHPLNVYGGLLKIKDLQLRRGQVSAAQMLPGPVSPVL